MSTGGQGLKLAHTDHNSRCLWFHIWWTRTCLANAHGPAGHAIVPHLVRPQLDFIQMISSCTLECICYTLIYIGTLVLVPALDLAGVVLGRHKLWYIDFHASDMSVH